MLIPLVRRSLLKVALCGIGVAALAASPASAYSWTHGAVAFSWNFNPGFLGGGCAPQSITLAPITLDGVFFASDGQAAHTDVAAGAITTSIVTGGSAVYPIPLPPPIGCVNASENALAGAGNLNPFAFTGTTAIVGTVSNGSCGSGTYVRVGLTMRVDLSCSMIVTGPPGNTGQGSSYGLPPFDLRIVGTLAPDPSRGSTAFVFVGSFSGVNAT
jgi:hypothetical protein